jgi:GPH family glycoside/pentoside/hexuronide:cation symporter
MSEAASEGERAGQGDDQRLGFGEKLIYGVGEIGPGLAENAIGFFLLFYYTKVVLLDPGLCGLALMIGRFWDAFTDPLMGYLSDQARTRWGRRRPFLLFGALPYGLLFFLLWAPMLGVTGNAAFPLLLFGFLAYSTAATVCQVPYYTLGGELSNDYHERSSIVSFRQVFAALGILIGGAMTPVVVSTFGGVPYQLEGSRVGWLWMAGIFGALGVVSWLITAIGTRERAPVGAAGPAAASLWEVPAGSLRASLQTLKNPHFRIMASVFLVVQISFTMTTVTLPFLLDDWVGRPELLSAILAVMIVVMLPSLGLWVRASRRIGKRRSYLIGLGIMGVLSLQTIWYFQPDTWVGGFYLYVMIFAVGLASHFVFPWAMMPDIIDYDELETGTRQDGPYFGVMTFLRKSSSAISNQVAGLLLGWIGYDATLAVQSDGTLWGLRLTYGLIPGVAFLAGMFLFSRFALTESASREIRDRLGAGSSV